MTLTTINLAALGDTINLATEVTGTLPVPNGGTGLASGTTDQLLKFTGSTTLASSAISTGKVIQTVSATGGAELMTSSTFNSTGLYATITPTAATSRLLVFATTPRIYNNGTEELNAQIWKGTSGEASGSTVQGLRSDGAGFSGNTDSPATMSVLVPASGVTTAATTFTVMHANGNNSSLVGWYQGLTGAQGELIIMEISA